jgi:N-acetyl sugar amidotransferase
MRKNLVKLWGQQNKVNIKEIRMNGEYRICNRCIMDTTDPLIEFDESGICSHCRKYDRKASIFLRYDENGRKELLQIVEKIKHDGQNKEYDCLMGISGGVDSTTLAYRAKKLGLRPLALHLDNGWDSEMAVSNIETVLRKLDIDLYTYVLNWEEFKDLHLSFLKASVPNSEVPTDHVIAALLYRQASKRKIPYVLSGGNIVTETIMPFSWGYYNVDWKHIKAVHKRFGAVKLKTFIHLSLFDWVYFTFIKGIKFFRLLNYEPYDKRKAKQILIDELGWKDYGGKHYESVYTRFFQGYILPTKFGFDKRRAHLSTLICSGQITRDEALREMQNDPYLSEELKLQDKEYVIKKLGLTKREFEEIMALPPKSYKDYPNNYFLLKKFNWVAELARKRGTYG